MNKYANFIPYLTKRHKIKEKKKKEKKNQKKNKKKKNKIYINTHARGAHKIDADVYKSYCLIFTSILLSHLALSFLRSQLYEPSNPNRMQTQEYQALAKPKKYIYTDALCFVAFILVFL